MRFVVKVIYFSLLNSIRRFTFMEICYKILFFLSLLLHMSHWWINSFLGVIKLWHPQLSTIFSHIRKKWTIDLLFKIIESTNTWQISRPPTPFRVHVINVWSLTENNYLPRLIKTESCSSQHYTFQSVFVLSSRIKKPTERVSVVKVLVALLKIILCSTWLVTGR